MAFTGVRSLNGGSTSKDVQGAWFLATVKHCYNSYEARLKMFDTSKRDMKRTVYVLGAGFCRDFNETIFPLVCDFLSMAKSFNIYQPNGSHRELASFIYRYFGDEVFPDVEKVLSFLATTPFESLEVNFEKRSQLYDELVAIIVRMLTAASATVANMNGRDVWKLYSKFIDHLIQSSATVLTFNYDLLLEELLSATNLWQMYDGYGVDIPLIHNALPTPSFGEPLVADYRPRASRSNVILLKMHGSINWGIPIDQAKHLMDKGDLIYRLPEHGKSLAIDYFQLPAPDGLPLVMIFKPVIVPPVMDKSAWLQNRTFRSIWNMALRSLQEAGEITFVGFSLPPTDFMADALFRQGRLGNTKDRISVVAPNASEMKPVTSNCLGIM